MWYDDVRIGSGDAPLEQKSATVQAALIGLIGTILTSCSGCFGAVLSAAVTVYSVHLLEVNFVPQPDGHPPVWDDLQYYAASFRIIKKTSPTATVGGISDTDRRRCL